MITFYDFEMSASCYPVRLLLKLLEIPHQSRPVDVHPGREHRSEALLALNPRGSVPVLTDEALTLCDPAAILVYLASRYDPRGRWYPRDNPALLGEITQWLLFAEALGQDVTAARAQLGMFSPCDLEACQERARALLRLLDRQLWWSERAAGGWVCGGEHPSIAELACFPFVMLSEEGGIARRDYAALRRWGDRVRALPGFIPMSGIFAPAVA